VSSALQFSQRIDPGSQRDAQHPQRGGASADSSCRARARRTMPL
jgi:hypothetical protein